MRLQEAKSDTELAAVEHIKLLIHWIESARKLGIDVAFKSDPERQRAIVVLNGVSSREGQVVMLPM